MQKIPGKIKKFFKRTLFNKSEASNRSKNIKNDKSSRTANSFGSFAKNWIIIIISLILLGLYINISVNNIVFDFFNPLFVLPLAVFLMIVLVCIYNKLIAGTNFLEKHYKKLLVCILAVMLTAQIICADNLRYTPAFDLKSIYLGGQELIKTGELGQFTEYFGMFSNNLGGLGIFTVLSGFCHLFGVEDYFGAAMIFNSLLLVGSMACIFFCAKKMLGTPAAFFTLIAVMMLPSFYTFGATFYTDILSIPFAAGSFLAYLHAKDDECLKKRVVSAVICAILLAIGIVVKGTVAILMVVYVVDILLSGIRKHAVTLSVLPIGMACLLLLSTLLSTVVPKDVAYEKGIPLTHWIAMSAHGNGTYNGNDYALAKERENKDERIKADLEIIKQRYKENGIKGTFELWNKKIIRDFGNGTFATYDFLDDKPVKNEIMQKTVLKEGKHFTLYANLSQAFYIALMLLAAIGIFFNHKDTSAFIPLLAIFGLLIFLLFWEASSRYVTNFIPFMLLGGAVSVRNISTNMQTKKESRAKRNESASAQTQAPISET